ncbi:Cyanate hydratase [Paraburkholderia phenoliruptrix]|uniref:Cyanate hydratase n=1 Tax=Paraburkholderia phenoliruptrix TaxID=252970 RepID=A0A6J5C3R2_9BURK|nr:Cyanate hydratase [Paraburkholderia phenoliruptrix]
MCLLKTIPVRGSIPGGVPTDPTIYRFYEMVQVYGSTLKALVHEKFGGGIISAINFKLDIQKVPDREGGERAVMLTQQQEVRQPLPPFALNRPKKRSVSRKTAGIRAMPPRSRSPNRSIRNGVIARSSRTIATKRVRSWSANGARNSTIV